MSPRVYCDGCRFDPAKSIGEDACPFTTLYWNFLQRHAAELRRNPRMSLQLRNLQRLSTAELEAIGRRAAEIRAGRLDGAAAAADA
jgi:deoxyribodipyrimidine photolyase-related protein